MNSINSQGNKIRQLLYFLNLYIELNSALYPKAFAHSQVNDQNVPVWLNSHNMS